MKEQWVSCKYSECILTEKLVSLHFSISACAKSLKLLSSVSHYMCTDLMFPIPINFSRNYTSSIKPSLSFVTELLVANTYLPTLSENSSKVYFLASEIILRTLTTLPGQATKTSLSPCTIPFSSYSFKQTVFFLAKRISTLLDAILCSMNMINEFSCNLIGLL